MDKLIKMSSWPSQEPKATIINLKSFKSEDKSEWWMINEKFLNLDRNSRIYPWCLLVTEKSKSFHLSDFKFVFVQSGLNDSAGQH